MTGCVTLHVCFMTLLMQPQPSAQPSAAQPSAAQPQPAAVPLTATPKVGQCIEKLSQAAGGGGSSIRITLFLCGIV